MCSSDFSSDVDLHLVFSSHAAMQPSPHHSAHHHCTPSPYHAPSLSTPSPLVLSVQRGQYKIIQFFFSVLHKGPRLLKIPKLTETLSCNHTTSSHEATTITTTVPLGMLSNEHILEKCLQISSPCGLERCYGSS